MTPHDATIGRPARRVRQNRAAQWLTNERGADLPDERWRSVAGFEGAYEVSDLGRVRSISREWQESRGGCLFVRHAKGQLLSPGRTKTGHLTVCLGRGNSKHVHNLVLNAFVGPCPSGLTCRHGDGDEQNNALLNLSWSTRGDNFRDKKWHRGVLTAKLTTEDVAEIKTAFMTPARGLTMRLAARFDVSHATISSVRAERTHRDVSQQGDKL